MSQRSRKLIQLCLMLLIVSLSATIWHATTTRTPRARPAASPPRTLPSAITMPPVATTRDLVWLYLSRVAEVEQELWATWFGSMFSAATEQPGSTSSHQSIAEIRTWFHERCDPIAARCSSVQDLHTRFQALIRETESFVTDLTVRRQSAGYQDLVPFDQSPQFLAMQRYAHEKTRVREAFELPKTGVF